MRFANAIWDETSRLDTVSPAGQMEAAEDDILPAVPELNMPPRHVKKYAPLPLVATIELIPIDPKQRRHHQLSELCSRSDA
jgi:hypothetical protein